MRPPKKESYVPKVASVNMGAIRDLSRERVGLRLTLLAWRGTKVLQRKHRQLVEHGEPRQITSMVPRRAENKGCFLSKA